MKNLKFKNGIKHLLIDVGLTALVMVAERMWKAAQGLANDKQKPPPSGGNT